MIFFNNSTDFFYSPSFWIISTLFFIYLDRNFNDDDRRLLRMTKNSTDDDEKLSILCYTCRPLIVFFFSLSTKMVNDLLFALIAIEYYLKN